MASNGCGLSPSPHAQNQPSAGSLVFQEYQQIAANLRRAIARKRISTNFNSSYFRMRTLLLNLCIADLIVTFLLIPLEIAWRATVSWKAGDVACRLFMFVRIFGLYLSSFVLVCIAIDRYLSILHPLSVRYAEKRQRRMMWASWILSILCSLPQSFIFHVATHPTHPDFKQCVTFSFFTSRYHELTYNIMCMVAMYGGPLMIILVLYSKVLYKMYQSTRNLDGMAAQKHSQPSSIIFSSTSQHRKSLIPNRNISVQFTNKHTKNRLYKKSVHKSTNTKQFYSLRSPAYRHEINNQINVGQLKKQPLTQISMQRHFDFGSIKKAQAKNLKLTVYIIIAFFCCWTPFYAMAMFFWFAPEKASKTSNYIQEIFFMFAVSNSCINPLIYGRFVCVSLRSKTWRNVDRFDCDNNTVNKLKSNTHRAILPQNKFYFKTGLSNGQTKRSKSTASSSHAKGTGKLSRTFSFSNNDQGKNTRYGRKGEGGLGDGMSSDKAHGACGEETSFIQAPDKLKIKKWQPPHKLCHRPELMTIKVLGPNGRHCNCNDAMSDRKMRSLKATQSTNRKTSIIMGLGFKDQKRKSVDGNFFSKIKRPSSNREKTEVYLKGKTPKPRLSMGSKDTGPNKQSKPFYRILEMHEQKLSTNVNRNLKPFWDSCNSKSSLSCKFNFFANKRDYNQDDVKLKHYVQMSKSHDNISQDKNCFDSIARDSI